jgi:hypothetical protein
MHVHLIALVAIAGCSGDEQTGDTGPNLPPMVEIGTGETEFVPLEDGDEVDIIFGPQGGYHFNTSIRVQGIHPGDPDHLDDPDNPLTVLRAFLDGEQIDLDASTYKQGIDPVPGEPGVYQMIGRRLILDIQSDDELDGRECLIDVTITDRDGVEVHDERTIIAVPSPFNDL